jgi:uncharacterized repeat protein (TIGR01451 family)
VLRQVLAALFGQSLTRIAARPADFWMKVKTRWRHNPGFVAAAAAGTIGIALAIVLGVQGGLRLLDDPEPGDDLATDSSTELGDADGGLSGGAQSDLRDLFEESEPPVRAPRRPARAARSNDDLLVELEDDETVSAPKTLVSRASMPQQKDPFDTDDTSDADDRPLKIKPRSQHPLNDDPPDDDSPDEEEEAPRKIVQLPVEAEDELAADESEVEPAKIAAKGATGKAAPLESKTGPSLGDEESGADASEATSEPEIAETDDKDVDASDADEKRPDTPGWKNQRSKQAVTEDPPIAAQKSRAVETVIYSTPAKPEPSGPDTATASAEEARPSRLLLEILGPKAARVGQTCNFEIRVRNVGKTTAEKVTLSVELPAALVHEVAPSLEQQVGSLAPGKTYRALVRTQAKATGRVTLKTDVAIQGQIEAKSSATIDIGGGSSASRTSRR